MPEVVTTYYNFGGKGGFFGAGGFFLTPTLSPRTERGRKKMGQMRPLGLIGLEGIER